MITAGQIKDVFTEKNISGFNELYLDTDYVCPSIEWVEKTFSRAFRTFIDQLEIFLYRVEKNDCDNFSLGARFFASALHARTVGNAGKALAFGEFHYQRDSGGGHAINFFISKLNDFPVVCFYEPQNQSIVELSESEIASCVTIII